MSKVLDRLKLSYDINSMPEDGDCFYHAFIGVFNLNISPLALRKFIAQRITEEDSMVFSALYKQQLTVEDVCRIIKYTNVWADEVEISVLIRSIPNLGIIIVDENQACLCKKGSDNVLYRAVFLLKNEHYYIVKGVTSELFSIMLGQNHMHIDIVTPYDYSNVYFVSLISIVSWLVIRRINES